MKIQSLAIIFIIIIMPISIVLSEYVNNQIETKQTELLYNTRLLNSTYDAIKAYQLNTVNNSFGDITNQKVKDIESAAKTFYNSLSSNFNYTGYRSEVMKEYVPTIVFTMYDGYYAYSPFTNTLTELKDGNNSGDETDQSSTYDSSYSQNDKQQEGLKPYVYYTCRYKFGTNNDFSITYTLDNYITIQGVINGEYVYDYGYLYSIATSPNNNGGIFKSNEKYLYGQVQFEENESEELKEYVPSDKGDSELSEYSYVKINGQKYYLDEDHYEDEGDGTFFCGPGVYAKKSSGIFYIDTDGKRNYSQTKQYSKANDSEMIVLKQYIKAIKKNKSAYQYYKEAYNFSKAVLSENERTDKLGNTHGSGYNLKKLLSANAVNYNKKESNITSLSEYGNINIFEDNVGNGVYIESSSSNFNQHRKAVIRNVIETNLSAAISSFSSSKSSNFLMPKISETDWETIENDVCAISFLQGMSIGGKRYNGYAVVANTLTKEYVDENDIYIIKNDDTYCKVNDGTIKNNTKGENELGYYPGVWKLDFEQKQGIYVNTSGAENTIYYNPKANLGSYTSIMGGSNVNSMEGMDMYKYIETVEDAKLKRAYLYALGRERWGSYNVNNINYELNKNSTENNYFLYDYRNG